MAQTAVGGPAPAQDELAESKTQLREQGWCVLPGVLSARQVEQGRKLLWSAAEAQAAAGVSGAHLDPNDRNVRVFNLPAVDRYFIDLLVHPLAMSLVRSVLDTPPLVSNFTANIALPGSGSMRVHSDQALVVPEPWTTPWAINIIWCLDAVREENGATRYLPDSHHFSRRADVPADAEQRMRAYSAPAGSLIAMDGRVWHTSGSNVTVDEQRAMLFAYYSADFLRQQMNWSLTLPPKTIEAMSDSTKGLFGISASGNTRIGAELTELGGR
ncbi:phytanoyl-CoA dioxygenase family protein [Nocardia bovistercoris]|uniref:Phytanoyl-CoA dioxygenase family protein n=1 Tax=Nocardia bovistercoris TaxID=2785916 RepID=A0A931IG56_9NOCA|nr:phytanoyl-CoA dioxygenase family protein [Nocardia bovistercoris]MBH0779745.1 phytanoyl-CoA dioxygenase family protein [Nocardia bovistercoris]